LALGEQCPNAGLLGIERRLYARLGEDLARQIATGHASQAQPDQQVGFGEVLEATHRTGVSGWHGYLKAVPSERLWLFG